MEIKITSLLLLGLCASALAGKMLPQATTEATPAPARSSAPVRRWTYDGEEEWASVYPDCGGTSQSPINIVTVKTKKSRMGPIKFRHYDVLPTLQTITNDGHSLKVELTEIAKTPYILDATENADKYKFISYHFHFGSVNSRGSEHTIDTVRYPMELHLVHVNAKYKTVAEAFNHPDGLVVLGILFVMSAHDNPALAPLIDIIPDIMVYNSSTYSVQETSLYALQTLLPHKTKRFFRYQGSLTTPTCNEVVTWNVFEKNKEISQRQINTFRSLIGINNQSIMDNVRSTQPLNGRTVFRSFMI